MLPPVVAQFCSDNSTIDYLLSILCATSVTTTCILCFTCNADQLSFSECGVNKFVGVCQIVRMHINLFREPHFITAIQLWMKQTRAVSYSPWTSIHRARCSMSSVRCQRVPTQCRTRWCWPAERRRACSAPSYCIIHHTATANDPLQPCTTFSWPTDTAWLMSSAAQLILSDIKGNDSPSVKHRRSE